MNPHSFIHHWLLSKQVPSPGEVQRAGPPSVGALEFWDYRISLEDAASCLLLMHCRGSCIQTMNFQHTSFSCKPTSPEIASSFGGDAGRAPEVKS